MAKKKPSRQPPRHQGKKPAHRPSPPGVNAKRPKVPTTTARRPGKGPTEPSRPTVKRLFALSGNRCAFPGCPVALVDPRSDSVIGQICHIKGENPGSKRHDKDQTDEERHSAANLILMCGQHHKVIDDDDKTYTVERLLAMKQEHEKGQPKTPPLTDRQAERLITDIRNNTVNQGSIIQPQNQSGGQVAHTIHNYTQPPSPDEDVKIEASLGMGGSLDQLQAIGCPGLELKVVCRSKRPAKIRKAELCAEGKGFVAAFESGFGASFDHNPPKGLENEIYFIELLRISPLNTPEGYVISRDDVRRFYLPMSVPGLEIALSQPPDKVTIRVVFFDDSESEIMRGEEVQTALRSLFELYSGKSYKMKVPVQVGVRVSSTNLPRVADIVGKTNPNPVQFGRPADTRAGGQMRDKVAIEIGVLGSPITQEQTIGLQVANISPRPFASLSVAIEGQMPEPLAFTGDSAGALPANQHRTFALPFKSVPALTRLVASAKNSQYSLVIRSESEELLRVPGHAVQRLADLLTEGH